MMTGGTPILGNLHMGFANKNMDLSSEKVASWAIRGYLQTKITNTAALLQEDLHDLMSDLCVGSYVICPCQSKKGGKLNNIRYVTHDISCAQGLRQSPSDSFWGVNLNISMSSGFKRWEHWTCVPIKIYVSAYSRQPITK